MERGVREAISRWTKGRTALERITGEDGALAALLAGGQIEPIEDFGSGSTMPARQLAIILTKLQLGQRRFCRSFLSNRTIGGSGPLTNTASAN